MDTWTWPVDAAPSCGYFRCVSTIARIWRSPGSARKIRGAAFEEALQNKEFANPDLVVRQHFSTIPGRCLRGRWLSIDGVERTIAAASVSDLLGRVFARLWPPPAVQQAASAEEGGAAAATADEPQGSKAKRRKTTKKPPGREEQEQYEKEQKQLRDLATEATNNLLFMIMVDIAIASKAPLVRFMAWVQKAVKEQRKRVKDAKKAGVEYLGPTPLSQFVTTKFEEIKLDALKLVHDEASGDDPIVKAVMGGLPDELVPAAQELFMTLILLFLAQWEFRYGEKVRSFPLRMLHLCELPATEDHPVRTVLRRGVARALLDTSVDELQRMSPFSDVPEKTKVLFHGELQEAAATGRCPLKLYTFALLMRARLPCETQEVEGMNSVLQKISDAAPNARFPVVSDRLRNRYGCGDISAEECVAMHQLVLQRCTSTQHAQRFLSGSAAAALVPVPRGDWIPPPAPVTLLPLPAIPEESQSDLAGGLAANNSNPPHLDNHRDLPARLARAIRARHDGQGLKFAYSFGPPGHDPGTGLLKDREGFIICWSYNSNPYVATGLISETGGGAGYPGLRFNFPAGCKTQRLDELVERVLRERPLPAGARLLDVLRWPVEWVCRRAPLLDVTKEERLAIKPLPPKPRAPKTKTNHAGEPGATGPGTHDAPGRAASAAAGPGSRSASEGAPQPREPPEPQPPEPAPEPLQDESLDDALGRMLEIAGVASDGDANSEPEAELQGETEDGLDPRNLDAEGNVIEVNEEESIENPIESKDLQKPDATEHLQALSSDQLATVLATAAELAGLCKQRVSDIRGRLPDEQRHPIRDQDFCSTRVTCRRVVD